MNKLKEVDGDLRENWYILVLDQEVGKKPIKRSAYNQDYVVFRDENGRMVAVEDRCNHRGAQLSKGEVKDGCIRCPYHGWKFDGQGNLVEVPSQGDKPLKAQRMWNLKRPIQAVQDGCLWIWCGDKEPEERLPTWRFPFHSEKGWNGYFMITDFDNEVTHLLQNFMDVPHTVFVHKHWFRNQTHLKVPITLDVGDGKVKVTYHQKNDSIGFFSRMLNPKNKPMVHTDEFIYPNLTRVDYVFGDHHFVINSECTPISRYKTRVYTWITFNLGRLGRPIKPFMRWYTRAVIQQDVEIMKNQGDNFKRLEESGQKIVFKSLYDYHSTAADELHLAIDDIREKGVNSRSQAHLPNYSRERELWI